MKMFYSVQVRPEKNYNYLYFVGMLEILHIFFLLRTFCEKIRSLFVIIESKQKINGEGTLI